MNRRTLTATAATVIAVATLAGCKQTTTATSGGTQQGATSYATTNLSPAAGARPSCTIDYGPNQAGIYAAHHKVDGAITLDCNGATSDVFMSLTLAYIPPGGSPADDLAAPGATYSEKNAPYTATAPCQNGGYALHVLYGAEVDNVYVSGEAWGKTAVVTAADCARG